MCCLSKLTAHIPISLSHWQHKISGLLVPLACWQASDKSKQQLSTAVEIIQTLFQKVNQLIGCRVFQPTKNAFVDALRSVLDDIKWSLMFLVLTMWGFAGAFYILFREEQGNYQVTFADKRPPGMTAVLLDGTALSVAVAKMHSADHWYM